MYDLKFLKFKAYLILEILIPLDHRHLILEMTPTGNHQGLVFVNNRIIIKNAKIHLKRDEITSNL